MFLGIAGRLIVGEAIGNGVVRVTTKGGEKGPGENTEASGKTPW